MRKKLNSNTLFIVIGRKINYSVPDEWYFLISDHLFITDFLQMTGIVTLASAWRGGIGKYPQNPERLRQYLRPPEAKPTEEEVLPQPRRMRRVFSNTSEPC